MLFNSLQFLIFFPIVTLVYFLIPHKIRYLWLLGASYYFYMCWNPQYALLMLLSTALTYVGGSIISHTEKASVKKAAVGINFAVNLLILFFFKYFFFTVENINHLLAFLNIAPITPHFDVILPVGISFYTFQALSYTMDVYRGDIKHEANFLRYALFVSFFPQLVAGPIERSKNLLHQLKEKHTFNYEKMTSGLLLMLWGFFQKLVIADRAAILVDTVYNSPDSFFGFHFAVATVLFAVQIYCDFSSYTTIARGAARVMGIELMENFNVPYFAVSASDFWSRWHLSLTNWFRDYLYIPLGGNRKGKIRKYFNIFIVFLASGLWHGANWTYVLWGLFHGIWRIAGDITKSLRLTVCRILHINRQKPYYPVLQAILTFSLVCFSWILFRAKNAGEAMCIFRKIFCDFHPELIFGGGFIQMGLSAPELAVLGVAITVLFLADTLKYKKVGANALILDSNIIFRFSVVLVLLFATLVFGIYGAGYDSAQFIYFQF